MTTVEHDVNLDTQSGISSLGTDGVQQGYLSVEDMAIQVLPGSEPSNPSVSGATISGGMTQLFTQLQSMLMATMGMDLPETDVHIQEFLTALYQSGALQEGQPIGAQLDAVHRLVSDYAASEQINAQNIEQLTRIEAATMAAILSQQGESATRVAAVSAVSLFGHYSPLVVVEGVGSEARAYTMGTLASHPHSVDHYSSYHAIAVFHGDAVSPSPEQVDFEMPITS